MESREVISSIVRHCQADSPSLLLLMPLLQGHLAHAVPAFALWLRLIVPAVRMEMTAAVGPDVPSDGDACDPGFAASLSSIHVDHGSCLCVSSSSVPHSPSSVSSSVSSDPTLAPPHPMHQVRTEVVVLLRWPDHSTGAPFLSAAERRVRTLPGTRCPAGFAAARAGEPVTQPAAAAVGPGTVSGSDSRPTSCLTSELIMIPLSLRCYSRTLTLRLKIRIRTR